MDWSDIKYDLKRKWNDFMFWFRFEHKLMKRIQLELAMFFWEIKCYGLFYYLMEKFYRNNDFFDKGDKL